MQPAHRARPGRLRAAVGPERALVQRLARAPADAADAQRRAGPLHPPGLALADRAAGDRVARDAHLPLPLADPLDAHAQARAGDRLRAPREARRQGLPAGGDRRSRSPCSRR